MRQSLRIHARDVRTVVRGKRAYGFLVGSLRTGDTQDGEAPTLSLPQPGARKRKAVDMRDIFLESANVPPS